LLKKFIKGILSPGSYPEGCLKSKRIIDNELALLENGNYWRKGYGSSPGTSNGDQVLLQKGVSGRMRNVAQATPPKL